MLALGNVAFAVFAIAGTILNGAGMTRPGDHHRGDHARARGDGELHRDPDGDGQRSSSSRSRRPSPAARCCSARCSPASRCIARSARSCRSSASCACCVAMAVAIVVGRVLPFHGKLMALVAAVIVGVDVPRSPRDHARARDARSRSHQGGAPQARLRRRRVMTKLWLVVLVVLASCGGALGPTATESLTDSVRIYNDGIRWQRWDNAANFLPPKDRGKWVDDEDAAREGSEDHRLRRRAGRSEGRASGQGPDQDVLVQGVRGHGPRDARDADLGAPRQGLADRRRERASAATRCRGCPSR